MIHVHKAKAFDSLYHDIYRHVKVHGTVFHPRAQECTEVRPGIIQLLDPSRGMYTGRSRKLNYRFWIVEALTYLAGWGDSIRHSELMVAVNKNMANYINPDTEHFDGAYGPRLSKSLPAIAALLERDPSSRQAVASIWSPGIPAESKDIPCTLSLHFFAEGREDDPKLGLSVTMRSNDLDWGTPYDIGCFCLLQCVMADCLGWKLGTYTHVANSLHYYATHPPAVETHAQEDFINFSIPRVGRQERGNAEDNLREVMVAAHYFLFELHIHHVQQGGAWSEYKTWRERGLDKSYDYYGITDALTLAAVTLVRDPYIRNKETLDALKVEENGRAEPVYTD